MATFSISHFEKMARFGSLFVQHIKSEGKLLQDDGTLMAILNSFSPRGDYRAQLLDAFQPLTWLQEPYGPYWKRLCTADILYVACRNAAVLANGLRGEFVFDPSKLFAFLAHEAGLTPNSARALSGLRSLKWAYRNRSVDADVTHLNSAIGATKMVASHFRSTYDKPVTTTFRPNGYHELRRLEHSLLELNDPRELDALVPGDRGYEDWKLICNPADYPRLQRYAAYPASTRLRISEMLPEQCSALPPLGTSGSP